MTPENILYVPKKQKKKIKFFFFYGKKIFFDLEFFSFFAKISDILVILTDLNDLTPKTPPPKFNFRVIFENLPVHLQTLSPGIL